MDKAEMMVLLNGSLGGGDGYDQSQDDPYSDWPGLLMFPPARQPHSGLGPVLPIPPARTPDKWAMFEPFTPEGP